MVLVHGDVRGVVAQRDPDKKILFKKYSFTTPLHFLLTNNRSLVALNYAEEPGTYLTYLGLTTVLPSGVGASELILLLVLVFSYYYR